MCAACVFAPFVSLSYNQLTRGMRRFNSKYPFRESYTRDWEVSFSPVSFASPTISSSLGYVVDVCSHVGSRVNRRLKQYPMLSNYEASTDTYVNDPRQ